MKAGKLSFHMAFCNERYELHLAKFWQPRELSFVRLDSAI